LPDNPEELIVTHALQMHGGHGGLHFLRHQTGDHAHELKRMQERRGGERGLAERLPRIAQIAEEILGQFVARARRPTTRPGCVDFDKA